MPRPTKRARTSQLATQAKKEKLQRDHDSEVSTIPSPASDTEKDSYSSSEWSEVEEDLSFPIVQPTEGWKAAERGVPSVVQGAAGEKSRSTQSYHKKNVS